MAASSSSSSSSSFHLCIISLLLLSSSISALTLPISHLSTTPFPDPYLNLNHLVSSSLTRAHHLKNPQITTATTPLSAHSYGGYAINLNFGTPSQTLSFVMDTGSDLVWFPCTHRYQCTNCSASPIFLPRLSSSSKILGCQNPKCSWIHSGNHHCNDCEPDSKNCSQICPPYLILYGSGSTGGIALSETLDLPRRTVPNFIVGCSVFSSRQPAGIAGFGRGPASLPSQLGLHKFSYCLLSHKFDDSSKTGGLVLDGEYDSGTKTAEVQYTPFLENPKIAGKQAFSVYYYVGLRKVTVGGRRVKIPYKYLKPNSDGNGGTIVDSGTTFTFMASEVFELVVKELENQVKKFKRSPEIETVTGLRPCYNVSGSKSIPMPEMRFHFKGGAEMTLPLENYFAVVGEGGVACLTVVTDGVTGEESSGGPAIVLGNFQMQNYEVEYDLRNGRLGFRQELCK